MVPLRALDLDFIFGSLPSALIKIKIARRT